MIAQLLSLILQVIRHLFVNLLEELVNFWQKLVSCILKGTANLLQCIFTDTFGALFIDKTTAGEVLLNAVNGTGELLEKVLPLLHFLFVSVPLREVTG